MYLDGWPMRGSNVASFSSAFALVVKSIQLLVSIFSLSAARMLPMSSRIWRSLSGG